MPIVNDPNRQSFADVAQIATSRGRPRVLHLRVAAGTGGGPEKTILNSPRFIKQYGYDALVAYLCPPNDPIADDLRRRADALECELIVIPDRGPFDLSVVARIIWLCKKHRIDILQTHDYKSNALGLLVRCFHRCRLATTLHGWTDMSGRMPIYVRIDRWCLPKYESLICVSPDLGDECRRLGIPDERIHTVPNAIDVQQYKRVVETSDAKLHLNARPGRYLIGSVGRLSPEKCFLELIETVNKLQKSGVAVDLWIAGDGPQWSVLEEKINALDCKDSIRLLGQISDPRDFYQAMDLFVLNSIREGLPNVILEAMAMETPVIATRIAGIPSLIQSGVTGQLVEPSDQRGLELAIRSSIDDSARQQRFAKNARSLIESQFSFEVRMKKIAAIYDQLLRRMTK